MSQPVSPPTPAPTPAPRRSESRRASLLEKGLGVLAALLGVVSALFGYQAATATSERNQAQDVATTNGADAATLRNLLDGTNAKLAEVEAENERLRQRTGAPSNPSTVRHEGPLSVAYGGNADLDSQSDSKWAATVETGADLFYGTSGGRRDFYVGNSATGVFLGAKVANYEVCSALNTYVDSTRIYAGELSSGTYLCIKTGSKRYAAVKIVDFNDDYIAVEIVAYDPPSAT